MDLNAAFAAAVPDFERAEEERETAEMEAAKEARRREKVWDEIELRSQGVTPKRIAWGYRTAGPEPDASLEMSGLASIALICLGPFILFAFASQDIDSCIFRPGQEICKAAAARTSPGQLSAAEQERQQAMQQASLNNAVRRQCLRNAMSEEDAGACPAEMAMPR